MGRRIKAQSSTEFVLFIAVIFLVVITVISSLVFYMREYTKEKEIVVLQQQALMIKNELYMAATVEDGYQRTFQIKGFENQISYNFTQINNSLLFNSRHQQYVDDIGVKMNGTLQLGNNTIRKEKGIIYVN